MGMLVIANQHAGPLPLKFSFAAPSDGPSTLIVTGSVWTSQASQLIGIEVLLDGTPVGTALVFSNLSGTHRAVVPTYIPMKLTFGQHTVTLTTSNANTVSDLNDYYSVVLGF